MITNNFLTKTTTIMLMVAGISVYSPHLHAQKQVAKSWSDGTVKSLETLDKKGFKSGECIYYHENGQMRLREFYVKGRRDGVCEGWFEDGTPEFTRSYTVQQRNNGSLAGTEAMAVKHGVWVEYHDNGNKKKEEHFDNGVHVGVVRTWYENGQLEESKTIEDKFENGPYEKYYENGQLEKQGVFSKGHKTGEWVTYHTNGQLAYRESFINDKHVDGPWKGYHANGTDSLSGSYTYGRKEGIWIAQHPDGSMKSKVLYKLNMPAGDFVEFYPNGNKSSEGAFGTSTHDVLRGREEGLWKEWHENGQPMSEYTYKDGRRLGPAKEWYANGQMKFETTYIHSGHKDDMMDGMTREWYENGQLMSEGVFVKGMRDGLWKEYYPSGALQMQAIFDRSKVSGSVTEFYENGKERSKGFYEVAGRKKLRTGRWFTYYESGSKESEGEFIQNKKVGRWQEWYANGNLRQDSFFEDGADQGPYKDFYENGVMRTEGQFKGIKRHKGLQNGVWKHYNESGELVLTETWFNGRQK